MSTYLENANVSIAERITRGVVGMGLVEVVLLVPALSPVAIAALSMISLYLVFTAIIARDPVTALAPRVTAPAGIDTNRAAHA